MSQNVQGTRSYFLWVFLGIITLGICFFVYNLLNFMDLDEHDRRYANRENAPSTNSQAWLMVLLCLFVPYVGGLIVLYIKYSKLHDHLAVYQGAPNIPDGMSILLINLLLSWISLGIIFLYFEWKWQDVFNDHNRWHAHQEAQLTR